ncbi:MAG: hypothetical protein AAFZ18_11270, partial [Myxococcota bacterium]
MEPSARTDQALTMQINDPTPLDPTPHPGPAAPHPDPSPDPKSPPAPVVASLDNPFLGLEEARTFTKEAFYAQMKTLDPEPPDTIIAGLWDGIVEEASSTWESLNYLWNLSKQELLELYDGVATLIDRLEAGEGWQIAAELGEAVGGKLVDAFRNFGQKPYYYGGFIAGGLLVGGAWGKLLKVLKLPGALGRLAKKSKSQAPFLLLGRVAL